MKKKLLITSLLAVLLAFGFTFVACGNNDPDPVPPVIPPQFAGIWDSIPGIPVIAPGPIPRVLIINSNGTGSVLIMGTNVPTTFSHERTGGIDKLTMDVEDIYIEVPPIGQLTFEKITFVASIVSNELVLVGPPTSEHIHTNTYLVPLGTTMSPYRRYGTGGVVEEFEELPPANLHGNWYSDYVTPRVFQINSDGTGTSINTFFEQPDQATWRVNESGTRLQLTTITEQAGDLVTTATFQFEVYNNTLTLSDPLPADSALAGFVYGTAPPLDELAGSENFDGVFTREP